MKIQSLQRAIDILRLFSLQQPSHALSEIASAMGLNKGTAWGLVTTLEQNGLLEQDPNTRRYRLGPEIYQLGMTYAHCLEINNRAVEPSHHLASRTKLTTRIGIWDRNAILVTMMVIPDSADKLAHQIGPRIPAYCTALGKAILAFLEPEQVESFLSEIQLTRYTQSTITSEDLLIRELNATRERGYSVSIDELIPDLSGIAAPIFGRNGSVAAAVSVASVKKMDRMFAKRIDSVSKEVVSAALEISQLLGFGPEAMKDRAGKSRRIPSIHTA
jgi:IclR family transcriptional regulator, KDG regulon repressor